MNQLFVTRVGDANPADFNMLHNHIHYRSLLETYNNIPSYSNGMYNNGVTFFFCGELMIQTLIVLHTICYSALCEMDFNNSLSDQRLKSKCVIHR